MSDTYGLAIELLTLCSRGDLERNAAVDPDLLARLKEMTQDELRRALLAMTYVASAGLSDVAERDGVTMATAIQTVAVEFAQRDD